MGKTVVQKVYTNPFNIFISIFAVMVSWFSNASIGLAILHYLIALPYLIYSLLVGKFADGGFMDIINTFF
jgi:hypothetical protein